ncbi:T6SS immunity protein Tli3 family protein, partial [Enterobacter chuandaensis]
MKALCSGMAVTAVLMTSGCQANEPPTQVVYRFDNHRYLELKGWDCEGELWYTDTQKAIHSLPYFQFYRIYTKQFIHSSERYIAIPAWESAGFIVSKDYGKTWHPSSFSPGENEPNGDNAPPYDDILSFTVVNDQGFLQTKHRLYMSSRPFDDPRLATGGPGINYVVEGVTHRIKPQSPGPAWGLDYITK